MTEKAPPPPPGDTGVDAHSLALSLSHSLQQHHPRLSHSQSHYSHHSRHSLSRHHTLTTTPASVAAVAGSPEAADENNDVGDDDDDEGDALDSDDESLYEEKLPYSKARCIALVATLTGATFSNTLSNQAVVIVLPTIGKALNIPDSRQQWIISAYSLAFGCFLLLWGRIADVFGKKAIFVAGSAWVTATTVANPFLPDEIAFDLFRGLQGFGAAANVPTALGILGTTFPPGKAKNYAFAAYGAGAPLGSVFGNLIGGLITSYVDWKWVFGVIAILVGLITVIGYLVIPNDPPPLQGPPPPPSPTEIAAAAAAAARGLPPGSKLPTRVLLQSIDWIGAFLVTLGLVGLLFALTEGNVVGWSTPWVGAVLGVSVVLVAIFVAWQLWLERPENVAQQQAGKAWPPPPLVRMSIFTHAKNGAFGWAMVIMAFFFSTFNGFLVYATYFYQDYQGLSAIQTTLRFIPTGVAGMLTCFCVARLLSRIPTYWLLLLGNAGATISNLLFAVPIPANHTSYFAYGFIAMILAVVGADTAWPCITLFASHALPRQDQALGGALVNMASQVGRAIGLAIATAVQTAVMASHRHVQVNHVGPVQKHDRATLLGLRAANWFNVATGVVSFLVVAFAFRGTGIVGKVAPRPARSPLRTGGGGQGQGGGGVGGTTPATIATPAAAATPARMSADLESGRGELPIRQEVHIQEK